MDKEEKKRLRVASPFIFFWIIKFLVFLWIITKDLLPEDFGFRHNFVYRIHDGYPFQSGFLRNENGQRNFLNPYADGFIFDFYVYVGENETSFQSESELLWVQKNVTYSPNSSPRGLQTRISVSENVQNNASLYLHLYLVKSGAPSSSFKSGQMNEKFSFLFSLESQTIHRVSRLNLYKRTRGDQFSGEMRSYWHPNHPIHLVHNRDSVDNLDLVETFPIFFNDQYNFLRDYKPIDQTTEFLPLHLTFSILDLAKYQHLTKAPEKSQNDFKIMKVDLFGWLDKRLVQTDEDKDFIKEKLINSDFAIPTFVAVFIGLDLFLKIPWELTFAMAFATCCETFQPEPGPKTLKGLSVRLTWFDLIKSLATFDTPFLLYAKLHAPLARGPRCEYDPETNRLDSVATRFFTAFVFLPSLVGYLVYSLHQDPNEGFLWHISTVFCDFFWYFGSIIWIPQLYIHCVLRSGHRIVGYYMGYKSIRIFQQIVSISYFLYNGLFWLVVKHHPAAIAGQLVDGLVCLVVMLQVIWYMKNKRPDAVSNKLEKSDDKKLPDLVIFSKSNLNESQRNESANLKTLGKLP